MCAGAPPPSSPDPLPSIVISPSDPVAMPPPPAPAPPAAAAEDAEEMPPPPAPVAAEDDEDEEDLPWPPMRMKLFPYAAYCVLGGMGRTGDRILVASVLVHYLNIVASLLSFYSGGERARCFWTLVSRVAQLLCYAFYTFITCVFIRYYMRVDGEYHLEVDLPPRCRQRQRQLAPAAAAEEAEQLPPPPPQMDMC